MDLSCLSEEQFLCSICLDVFTNPVSTPCGHSFCMECIGEYWDDSKHWQCPLCKETFGTRPDLHVNRTLREITEQFKRTLRADADVVAVASPGVGESVAAAVPGVAQEGGVSKKRPSRPGELPCDLFAEMKARFPKVLAEDVRPRCSSSPVAVLNAPAPPPPAPTAGPAPVAPPPPVPRRGSVSASPVTSEASLCAQHHQPLELFCRTDHMCVCALCMEREHRAHIAIPAKREWLIKKSQLGITEMEIRDMVQTRLKKVEEIRASLVNFQVSAERETATNVQLFTALMSSMERMQAELLESIQVNQLAAERHAQGLIRELELEIGELHKRMAAISQLSQSEDHVLCLKSFPALCTPVPTKDWSAVTVSSSLCSVAVLRRVSLLVERFQEELRKILGTSSGSFLQVDQPLVKHQPSSISPNLPAGLKKVQECAVHVTLDPSTAHPRLVLSEDGKQVRCGDRHQAVADNPDRFDRVVCVLGHQAFSSGRHYWEVEVGNKTDWDLGVASRSSNRKGKIAVSPSHGYWFLSLRDKHEYAFRTEPATSLGLATKPHKVGVFVDFEKGQLSFYNVDTKAHIYTFTDTFSDTIFPFFSPCTNKSGKNDAPLIITPVKLPG